MSFICDSLKLIPTWTKASFLGDGEDERLCFINYNIQTCHVGLRDSHVEPHCIAKGENLVLFAKSMQD